MIRLHEIWVGFKGMVNTYGVSFILGGFFFSIISCRVYGKIILKRVRRSNRELRELKRKTLLLKAFEGVLVLVRNMLTEMSYLIAEKSHEMEEIRKEVDKVCE